jgi:DNA-binding transcriptional LysR family regulator
MQAAEYDGRMSAPAIDKVDVRLLRTFLALMSERSVSRAAERIGVSQPAMSHALARLRVLFQDPLLLRSRQGMVVTDRAGEIERVVRRLLDEYDKLVGRPEAFEPGSSRRTFVVTAPEYAEHLLMPAIFARLRAEAPNIRILVRKPEAERVHELLESGEVDLRIAWLRAAPTSMRSMPLFQDRIVCIADRDHPSVRGSLSLAQYLSLPHARPYGTGRTTTGRIIDEAVERHGGQLELSFMVQSFMSIPRAIAGTDIIATLPSALATSFGAEHPLQVLESPLHLPRVRYAAYWHERSQKDPGHRWFRAVVAEAGRSLKLLP